MKTCSKCLKSLDGSSFHRNKSRTDGLNNRCKKCTKEDNRAHYLRNKEEISRRNRAYSAAHKEARRLRRAANADLFNQKARLYRQTERAKELRRLFNKKHAEMIAIRYRRWLALNAERVSVKAAQYRKANKSKTDAYNKQYYFENREREIARAMAWSYENYKRFLVNSNKSSRKRAAELADSYLRGLIKQELGLFGITVPQELIEAKQAHIAVKRLLQEKHRAQKDKNENAR
jgi:hypothetical protein